MPNFATDPSAAIASMSTDEMAVGFSCGTLNVDKLNWIIGQLFAGQTAASIASALAFVSCDGVPLTAGAALVTCDDAAMRFATSLHYAAATGVLSLRAGDGSTLSSVTLPTGGGPAPLMAPPAVTRTGTTGTNIAYTSAAWSPATGVTLTTVGLPASVTFTDNGNGTYSLGGTYPAVGSQAVTITGTGPGGTAAQTLTLTSTSTSGTPPVAPPAVVRDGMTGTSAAYTSDAWTPAGVFLTVANLPPGVTFSDNGNGTYTLGGVFPGAGTYVVTVTGVNSDGAASQTVTFNATAAATPPVAPAGAPFTTTGVENTPL